MRKLTWVGLAAGLAFALAACNNDGTTGPGTSGPAAKVSLSILVPGGGAAPSAGLFASGPLTLNVGGHTLVIETADVVLRQIELKRAESTVTNCSAEAPGSDDCEEFETGPMLLPLPLDGTVQQQLTVEVDTGTYGAIEFEVHKVGDDALDTQFLQGNPDFQGISIRVTGTYDGASFTFTSDLDAEQETGFAQPLMVTAADAMSPTALTNVTFSVDLRTWFVDPSTAGLIDPRTAVKGGQNEGLVKENIKASIKGFEDDDHDGVPHEDDPDEHAG